MTGPSPTTDLVDAFQRVAEALEQGEIRTAIRGLVEIREQGIVDRDFDHHVQLLRDDPGDAEIREVRSWIGELLELYQRRGGDVFEDLQEISESDADFSESELVPASEASEEDEDFAEPETEIRDLFGDSVAETELEEVGDGPDVEAPDAGGDFDEPPTSETDSLASQMPSDEIGEEASLEDLDFEMLDGGDEDDDVSADELEPVESEESPALEVGDPNAPEADDATGSSSLEPYGEAGEVDSPGETMEPDAFEPPDPPSEPPPDPPDAPAANEDTSRAEDEDVPGAEHEETPRPEDEHAPGAEELLGDMDFDMNLDDELGSSERDADDASHSEHANTAPEASDGSPRAIDGGEALESDDAFDFSFDDAEPVEESEEAMLDDFEMAFDSDEAVDESPSSGGDDASTRESDDAFQDLEEVDARPAPTPEPTSNPEEQFQMASNDDGASGGDDGGGEEAFDFSFDDLEETDQQRSPTPEPTSEPTSDPEEMFQPSEDEDGRSNGGESRKEESDERDEKEDAFDFSFDDLEETDRQQDPTPEPTSDPEEVFQPTSDDDETSDRGDADDGGLDFSFDDVEETERQQDPTPEPTSDPEEMFQTSPEESEVDEGSDDLDFSLDELEAADDDPPADMAAGGGGEPSGPSLDLNLDDESPEQGAGARSRDDGDDSDGSPLFEPSSSAELADESVDKSDDTGRTSDTDDSDGDEQARYRASHSQPEILGAGSSEEMERDEMRETNEVDDEFFDLADSISEESSISSEEEKTTQYQGDPLVEIEEDDREFDVDSSPTPHVPNVEEDDEEEGSEAEEAGRPLAESSSETEEDTAAHADPLETAGSEESSDALQSGAFRLLEEAEQLLESDNYESARDLVQSVLERNPDSDRAHEMLEEIEQQQTSNLTDAIGSLEDVPTKKVAMNDLDLSGADLDHRCGYVLSLIDGQITFEDVLEISSMPRQETLELLVEMLDEKLIDVR